MTADPATYGPLFPMVLLGDARWDRIVKALRQRNTKADTALADQVERSVERWRDSARKRAAEAKA